MKVKDCSDYNTEFPETFTWSWLDSPKLCNIANNIRNHIDHDLRTANRNNVPGLRLALNIIAEEADI
jgi:hypothetical protein